MATWRRCQKSPFYRRAAVDSRFDKAKEGFDKAYVDPVDLVLVRTMPWREDMVTVLRWQVTSIDHRSFDDLVTEEDELLLAWAERVTAEAGTEGGLSRSQKEAILSDIDVDSHSRDRLLDAIEHFVNLSPPDATELVQQKVPRNKTAVDGLLFHYGVGLC